MYVAKTPAQITGANVRAEMARAGVSQTELARRLDLSQASVSDRLRGRTAFDINELFAVAAALNVSIDVLTATPKPLAGEATA